MNRYQNKTNFHSSRNFSRLSRPSRSVLQFQQLGARGLKAVPMRRLRLTFFPGHLKLIAPDQAATAFQCLHKIFGYGIVLMEILRITLVKKSGETRSFVLYTQFLLVRKRFLLLETNNTIDSCNSCAQSIRQEFSTLIIY